MPKFLSGFAVGVFTGWLFHDTIDRNLRKVVETAQEKAEEKIDDIEKDTAEPGSLTASTLWPANGTTLDPERKTEINNSTPDNPVTITWDEVEKMNLSHVKVHIGSGRFKLADPA